MIPCAGLLNKFEFYKLQYIIVFLNFIRLIIKIADTCLPGSKGVGYIYIYTKLYINSIYHSPQSTYLIVHNTIVLPIVYDSVSLYYRVLVYNPLRPIEVVGYPLPILTYVYPICCIMALYRLCTQQITLHGMPYHRVSFTYSDDHPSRYMVQ